MTAARSRRGTLMTKSPLLLLLLAATVAGSPALAQTGDAAVAEALFRSARTLVAAGSYVEACPKFAESQRIDPKLGTLMNLALCHEKDGKTATAWAEYTQAGQIAARSGQPDRERVAVASAAALEAVLAHVVLSPETNEPITVEVDGKMMGAATLGTLIPVDPGAHEVVAKAPGRKTFTASFTVDAKGGDQTIKIPKLEVEASSPAPAAEVAPAPTAPTETPSVVVAYGHPRVGYALMGSAGVLLVTGAILGGLSFSEKSTVQHQCTAQLRCNSAGVDADTRMKAFETASTVTIGAGVLAGAAGLYFWLRSGTRNELPASPEPTIVHVDALVGPGGCGLSLSGVL